MQGCKMLPQNPLQNFSDVMPLPYMCIKYDTRTWYKNMSRNAPDPNRTSATKDAGVLAPLCYGVHITFYFP